jgi:cytoskeletal protein RodZ
MSEAHPDADLVKVTRTTTTYEPAETKTQPAAVKSRNRTMAWVVGLCLLAAVVVGGLLYASTMNTPAATQQSTAVADQQNAQTLSQQATTAQQTADQSAAQTRSLNAAAAKDRDAARRASVGAADSRDAAAAK